MQNVCRVLMALALPAFLLIAPRIAAAAPVSAGEVKEQLDYVWTLVAAGLVLLMQIGFLLLEAGMVRSKNSINVAEKNLLDLAFSVVVFAAFGFMFAFGQSAFGVAGFETSHLLLANADNWVLAFFTFQVMFCGTAATIVSGAVAERMKLQAYVLGSVFIAGIIYPVFVHWSWGAALRPNAGAFLGNLGFVDFAGSTVVHSTGGWVALAACMVLGPRLGRFRADGSAVRIHGHNPVLATAGAMLLFVGWLGFNGGSTVAATTDIAPIIANTVLAACVGASIGYVLGRWQDGVVLPEKTACGMIGGLVGVTAGCAVLTPAGAIAIGAIGAVVGIWGNGLLEKRFKVDDAVGAIGVHAFSGVAGTLGLAVLAPAGNLPAGDNFTQFGIQSLGVVINFAWSFGTGYIFFKLLDTLMRIRVSPMEEEQGLNIAEHGARLGIGHVEEAFSGLAYGQMDLSTRLPVEPGDEAERLTRIFNSLMESLEKDELKRSATIEEDRKAKEAERMSALANATFEAICISSHGRIIDGNDAFGRLLGCSIEDLKGRSLKDFVEAKDWERVSSHKGGDFGAPYEGTIRDINGHRIPIEVRAREITYRDAPARISALIDLRERKQAEAQIRHLAQHDPLTNLPNRALFNERLPEMVEETKARQSMSAVVLVDLDRFKDINDLYGHAAGDDVLREVADRLRAETRSSDMVARLGGDEFAILVCPIAFAAQAADLAHRLIARLSLPMTVNGSVSIRPGASIGVAICPRDGIEDVTLMTRADTALYHAKNHGRNQYAIFEKGMDAEIRRRQELEMHLENAVERDEFELYFQPRLDVATGRIVSYEALIRWHHPEKGMISPADFIPVAENSGRIIAIGEWAMRRACEIAVSELESHQGISVNVSPMQFREKNFVDMVLRVIRDTGIGPHRLEIEITESLLIDDDQRAIAMLNALKKQGVRVALDDFGTGYSSLGYLSRFPFDTIKIDRSFVDDMQSDENAMAIIETIIRLGRALDMSIVAEGVEDLEALRMLAEKGCDEVQGFALGRPLPLDQRVREPSKAIIDVVKGAHKSAATGLDAKGLRDHAEQMLAAAGDSDAGDKARPQGKRQAS